ncbi:MAG TPA: ThuA domain-containing protein [Planctomycetota bacterium]|nr:ThuA domain-containing protein [Planctomycetota bacterium]
MSKIKTLVYSGGEIHDWKGCGDAIHEALEAAAQFDITRVNNDLDCLVAPNLDPFEVIVFYHTVGSITDAQLQGLLKFVEGGKGYVGVHSAADSFRECSAYRYFVGGYFVTHPRYRQYQVSVADPTHPITKDIEEFFVTDEQYITGYDPRNKVLATALWKGATVPVVWTKSHGKGRIAYIALGHNAESCRDANFRTLLTRGTLWAAARPEG